MDWALPSELADVPGATELFDWFGYWPRFHDGEVLDLGLSRTVPSTLRVHTFHMTSEVDPKGAYVLTKHVVVKFILDDVTNLEANGFDRQNSILGLSLARGPDGYEIEIESCGAGLEATIAARRVRIELEPGIPPDSMYLKREAGGDSAPQP